MNTWNNNFIGFIIYLVVVDKFRRPWIEIVVGLTTFVTYASQVLRNVTYRCKLITSILLIQKSGIYILVTANSWTAHGTGPIPPPPFCLCFTAFSSILLRSKLQASTVLWWDKCGRVCWWWPTHLDWGLRVFIGFRVRSQAKDLFCRRVVIRLSQMESSTLARGTYF